MLVIIRVFYHLTLPNAMIGICYVMP